MRACVHVCVCVCVGGGECHAQRRHDPNCPRKKALHLKGIPLAEFMYLGKLFIYSHAR